MTDVLSTALPDGVSLPSACTTPMTKEDEYLEMMSTSSIVDLFDNEFKFKDGFGINAICSKHFDMLNNYCGTNNLATPVTLTTSMLPTNILMVFHTSSAPAQVLTLVLSALQQN
jgi:hypothetical protein